LKGASESIPHNVKSVPDPAEQAEHFFNRKDIFWAGVVFFISYGFYLFSLYPTITSEDSGEFTAAAYTLGIAHPPGYPLFVILAKIFTVIVPFGNIGWRVNLFSAFFAAATAAAVYFLLRLLTKDPAIGVITALFFAAGDIFWSQAVRAEVYSLNSFLMVAVIFLAVLWHFQLALEREAKAAKTLSWLAFMYGLSLANHQLMFLLGPPLALFILITKPKIVLNYRLLVKLVMVFLLGLSLYLFLPLRASYNPEVNWGNPVTWESFWKHVGRQAYGEPVAEPQAGQAAIQAGGTSLDFFRYHVYEFGIRLIKILDSDYTWAVSILSICGLIFLWTKWRKVFWLFLALIIFNSSVLSWLVGVGNTDKLPMRFFTDRPFFIPILLTTIILGGCGIRYLSAVAYEKGKLTAPAKERKKGIWVVAAILILLFAVKFPSQDQSGNYLAYDLAKAALRMLPQNAVLHSENSDNFVLPVLYLQKVEKYRTDVKIYVDMPNSIYNYFYGFERMEEDNPGRRLFTDFPFVLYPGLKYVYMGPVSEIVPADAQEDNSSALTRLSGMSIRGISRKNLDHFNLYLKARYLLDYGIAKSASPAEQDRLFQESFAAAPESQNITGQLIGYIYVIEGRYADAVQYLETAHKLMPEEYSISFQLAFSYIMAGESEKARLFISGLKADTSELLLKELKILASQQPEKYPALAQFMAAGPQLVIPFRY
jgi:hypothetical protein